MLDPSVCTLKGSKLFERLPKEAISEIETLCNWQEYGPDEVIIDASVQPPRDAVFFVVSGAVRVTTAAGQSGEIAFIDIGAGGILANYRRSTVNPARLACIPAGIVSLP
ncbi:MAG: cyclic nucleotide-binding domain-containing protein [Alphaproteobacteria bacterium]|nr:cyclic nucleotide-binding domain-containing protein [Alphaproteobacteria bacterium]